MPERLLAASPAKLMTWLDCPRRYRMTYLDRPALPKGPPWAHHSVGSAAHLALHDLFDLPVAARTPERAGALAAAAMRPEGFRDDAQREAWRARTAEMVAGYVASLDPELEPLARERRVATRTDVLALDGRVDRIDERPEGLAVVDYKTGRRPPTEDDVRSSAALAVYAAATERTLRRRCRTVELHHLPSGSVVSWEHTEDSLARHLRRLDALGREARSAEQAWRALPEAQRAADAGDELFPANPGRMCAWCDVARSCAAGRAVGPPKEPWAGLAEAPATPAEAPA